MESREGHGSTFRCLLPVVPRVAKNLVNLSVQSQLLVDPRELILKEAGEDLAI